MNTPSKEYQHWRDNLEGKQVPFHDDDPHVGFYRRKKKDGSTPDPVAIWREDDGTLLATIGNEYTNAAELWTWVCRHPVSYEDYQFAMQNGRWPDEAAPIGDNQPPEGEAEQDEIDSAIKATISEIGDGVKDKAHADRLAGHRERLTKLWKEIEAQRKAEKAPHDEAAQAVQRKYMPVLDKLVEAGNKIKAAVGKWQIAQEDKTGKRVNVGGTTAKTMALRTYKIAKITDYQAALQHFAEFSEIKDAVQSLCNRAVRAGSIPPGCEVTEERKSA